MRPARENVPDVLYHVISRFADHRWVITSDDEREHYLRCLSRALATSDWRCLAYAIMSSHIHLAMVSGLLPLSSWAKPAHTAFAGWMNWRQDRIGSVFAGRPKDYAILPAKEGSVLAYIHNNPVRAGVVRSACESTWTSHRAYLGLAPVPSFLDVGEGIRRCGVADATGFESWVASTPGESGVVDIKETRRLVSRLGGLNTATPIAGPRPEIPVVGRDFAHVRAHPREVVRAVAAIVGIGEAELCSRRRNATLITGRRIVVACGLAQGITSTDIAAALGVSPQNVSRLSKRALSPVELHAANRSMQLLRQWRPSPDAYVISSS